VAEGTANGWTWTSANVRGPAEQPPWADSPGGELAWAIASGIKLSIMTSAELDAAGLDPPFYILAPMMRTT
jgi:hypothetical protein